MRKILVAVALILGAFASAFATTLPLVPVSPQFSEASQIVPTFNAFIAMLNGNASPITANVAPGTIAFGTLCTASGATPQTCNGQRGAVTFTGVTVTNAATATVVVNDAQVAAASICTASIINNANAAQSTPFVSTLTPAAGTLTAILGNGSATSTGSVSIVVGFNCVN